MRFNREAAIGQEQEDRLRELKKCQTNLWYLATEYLNYGWNPKADPSSPFPGKGLTTEFHKPICDWLDRNRDELHLGLWFSRWHHKTTLMICLMIQEILRNPDVAMFYFQAVDEKAEEVVAEVANHVQHNTKLRALDPIGQDPETGNWKKVFPPKTRKKFAKADQFTLNRCGPFRRWPTLLGKGAQSEITGAHADVCFADDIIGRRTIENSELPKVASWWQSTVVPVVDGSRFRASGTPWSHEGQYTEWRESDMWTTLWIPGSVAKAEFNLDTGGFIKPLEGKHIEFTPNYKLDNPVFGPPEYKKKQIQRLKIMEQEMKGNFAPQIMVDPEPQSEKKWTQAACEHPITLKEAAKGDGIIVVLSDPAPHLESGYKSLGEKKRGDGTKDYWAISVWRIRVNGMKTERILLDGIHSQEWGHQDGANIAASLMKKWRTNLFFSEAPKLHFPYMKTACALAGVPLRRHKDGGPLRFAEYNKADLKNSRFGQLADAAKDEEIYICMESVPDDFLYGDRNRTGALTQLRKWVRVKDNVNSLRFDDDAESCAFVMDAAVTEFAPTPMVVSFMDRLRDLDDEEETINNYSRRCGI